MSGRIAAADNFLTAPDAPPLPTRRRGAMIEARCAGCGGWRPGLCIVRVAGIWRCDGCASAARRVAEGGSA